MITIKSEKEIEIMKEGGQILAAVLYEITKKVKPGVTTVELNQQAEELIARFGALPAFKGYRASPEEKPFPSALCLSLNEQIVHGAPSERRLQEGDILSIDLGILYPAEDCAACPWGATDSVSCGGVPGLFTDAAVTAPVGAVSSQAEKLLRVTRIALEKAIEQVRPGNRLGDIGWAIQNYVESEGLAVIRELVGHGVGHQIHEDPEICNFGKAGTGLELKEGMVLAIEPMVCLGRPEIKRGKDGFSYQTTDGSLSAHFEHTVAVTKDGASILTKID